MSIQDIVLSYISVKSVNSHGWHSVYCEHCGDGARTKGPRGGWNFDLDACFYHCFNCGVDANYDPTRQFPYSKEMHGVFKSFGIPFKEYNKPVSEFKLANGVVEEKKKKVYNPIKVIEVPDYFYQLKIASIDNDIAQKAKKMLEEKYHMSYRDYEFYLSSGITKSNNPKEISKAKYLMNRLIIPIYKNGEMVNYQARDLTDTSKNKYLSSEHGKGNVVYGMDNIFKDHDSPLFITEGFFDSYHLNGIATMENNVTDKQIDIIEKSPRRKIVVPDRGGEQKLALTAIDMGWEISLPDIGTAKDVTEAIGKYGKLYTLNSIMSNILDGDRAKAFIKNY